MLKLLTQCQTNPTKENAAKWFAYLRKHPMAGAFMTPEQFAFLQLMQDTFNIL